MGAQSGPSCPSFPQGLPGSPVSGRGCLCWFLAARNCPLRLFGANKSRSACLARPERYWGHTVWLGIAALPCYWLCLWGSDFNRRCLSFLVCKNGNNNVVPTLHSCCSDSGEQCLDPSQLCLNVRPFCESAPLTCPTLRNWLVSKPAQPRAEGSPPEPRRALLAALTPWCPALYIPD